MYIRKARVIFSFELAKDVKESKYIECRLLIEFTAIHAGI